MGAWGRDIRLDSQHKAKRFGADDKIELGA